MPSAAPAEFLGAAPHLSITSVQDKMTSSVGHILPADVSQKRDQFIPVRKTDIVRALVAEKSLGHDRERDKFLQLCRLLASIYHYSYFEQLERLRDAYYYFSPDLGPHAKFDEGELKTAYDDLIRAFLGALADANFVEVSQTEIARAHRERTMLRVEVDTPVGDFREVRFFRRGWHKEPIETSRWFGLRKQVQEVEVYDDVIVLVAMKSRAEIASRRELKRWARRKIRPGCVLIKYFRNIASADLNTLYPNVRVVMSSMDKLILGVPALLGGVPIVLNLVPTLAVLFLVLGFYLGISGAVEDDQIKTALGALSGTVALGGFLMRQWVKYQRQSLKYQKELSDKIYFRNINNNAGIFDYIIGAAEEQECKEAFLAYYFLYSAKDRPTQAALDARIEAWLKATFGVEIDFEADDALAKLDRLGLLRRQGDQLSVPTPEEALTRLDRIWDGFFRFEDADELKQKPLAAGA
jgi:Protein of unknown function (DUF3754)